MSAGEKAARNVVLVAAATLPAGLKEQYREQWLADLRDAPEVGMRNSDVAIGALALAVTVARPGLFSAAVVTPELAIRRSKRWAALALTSGVVSLFLFSDSLARAMTGREGIVHGLLGNFTLDFPRFVAVVLLAAFVGVTPIVSTVVLWRTPGSVPLVRWGVTLILLAAVAAVGSWIPTAGNIAHIPEVWTFAFGFLTMRVDVLAYAAALVVTAVLIARGMRGDNSHTGREGLGKRVAASASGAAVVWVTGVVGVINVLHWQLLDNRRGLSHAEMIGALPGEVHIYGSIWVADPGSITVRPAWDIMVELAAGWALAAAVVGILLGLTCLLPWFTLRRVRLLTLAALTVVVFSNGVLAQSSGMMSWGGGATGLTYSIPMVLGLIGAIALVQFAINPPVPRDEALPTSPAASSGPEVSPGEAPGDKLRPLGTAVERASG